MKNKYKATINIERGLWGEFLKKCKESGSNGSIEIIKFIKSFLGDDSPDNQLLKDAQAYTDRKFDEIIAELNFTFQEVNTRLDQIEIWHNHQKANPTTPSNLQQDIGTDAKTDTLKARKTDTLTDIKKDTSKDTNRDSDREKERGLKPNKNTIKPGKAKKTNNTKEESANITEKSQNTKSPKTIREHYDLLVASALNYKDYKKINWHNKRISATVNYASKSDEFVANAEGMGKSTLSNYRLGYRMPKDQSFWDRWRVSWDGKRWIDVTKPI